MTGVPAAPATLATAPTHSDPYPLYAELTARRPFGWDEHGGLWVAASAAAVTEVLTNRDCRVRPTGAPPAAGRVGALAAEVVGSLVRRTDGATQARRKRTLAAALDAMDAHQVRVRAAAETERAADWSDVQFGVPTRVLGGLLGVTGTALAELPALVGEFVRCALVAAGPVDVAAATEATRRLCDLMAAGGGPVASALRAAAGAEPRERAAVTANLAGLLAQTYEATAGLIGATLLMLARQPRPLDVPLFVAEVARYDAPVQNTRRFTASEVHIAGRPVPANAEILVLLAAANRDGAANPDPHEFRVDRPNRQTFTFGRAAHRCPGQVLATAITAGVVDAARGAPGCSGYQVSTNARIPMLQELST